MTGIASWGIAPAPAVRRSGAAKEGMATVLGGPEPPAAQQSWAARAAKALPVQGLPYGRGAEAVAAALGGCCNPGGQHCAFIVLLAALTALPELVDALLALPDCEKAVRGSACASACGWQLSGRWTKLPTASGFPC